jgi:hypothetical protein
MDAVTRAARRWEAAENAMRDAYEMYAQAAGAFRRARRENDAAARAFTMASHGVSTEYRTSAEGEQLDDTMRHAMRPVCAACGRDVPRDADAYPACSLNDADEFLCEGCAYAAMGAHN